MDSDAQISDVRDGAALPGADATSLAPQLEPVATEHPDGVYFGLDADEYHLDPALGSTDVRLLLKHPADYWWRSGMNPAREWKSTDYTQWGHAFHALILEGPDVFEQRFFRGPSKSDYPNLLVTVDDLKKWLSLRGYKTTGVKADLMERVKSADPQAPVWDAIEARHQVLANGRIVLKPETYDTVSISSKMITKNPNVAHAFSGGQPEVSIFWTVDVDGVPVRLKCRIDYLKIKALVDLKSFRNWREKSFDDAVLMAIRYNGYLVQAHHYLNGRAELPRLVREGKVFGTVPAAWLDRVVAAPEFGFTWVFYQAEGAPISRRFDLRRGNETERHAQADIRKALREYRRYLEVFGTDIWVDVSEPSMVDDEDLLPH